MKPLSAAVLLLTTGASEKPNPDWPAYQGDEGRRHYSALNQITPENVGQLEVVWRYDSGELREGNSQIQTSPIVIDGVLYGLSPTLPHVCQRHL